MRTEGASTKTRLLAAARDLFIEVGFDDFSLRERGIQTAELTAGVQQSSIEALVEMLVQENAKAIWH